MPHFDRVVGPDCQEEAVESGMMELAEREPVAHNRIALVLRIRDDVRRVEQFLMPKMADGALLAISLENALAKLPLVNATTECRDDVSPLDLSGVLARPKLRFSQGAESPLDIDLEDQSAWIVADDEDGVVRKVSYPA